MKKKNLIEKYSELKYYTSKDVVVLTRVKRRLRRLPLHIVDKLYAWARAVNLKGLHKVREIPGYHDEPLKGDRQGQRSIRLSLAYRAIYFESGNGEVNLVVVEEVTKHEY